ncbi:hypothetical protein LVY75_18945 [Sinorhizobium sp. B11]|uniref:phage regulatory CII family protein n=1 Tax=unclassified Rhizobium TaxID=2613769 RepID=UPI000DDA8A26|nr:MULTISPECIES: phage regulatory CII family protein [unclassified Rhizobium]MBB3440509.1 HAMP domain-containing protein [Rhizobium sp. BK379]MBB3560585.1 HAMP domain-containing protein [Rhizobium sp. BK512]
MTQRGRAFADIVYTILIVEKAYPVEVVATALGMNYAAFHSRLISRTCFSAEEIQNLLEVVPDPRLASYLFEKSIFVAAERSSDWQQQQPAGSLQRGATRVVIEATDVLEIVDAALAGGGMDHRKQRLVLKEIEDAERALASLRLSLNGAYAGPSLRISKR